MAGIFAICTSSVAPLSNVLSWPLSTPDLEQPILTSWMGRSVTFDFIMLAFTGSQCSVQWEAWGKSRPSWNVTFRWALRLMLILHCSLHVLLQPYSNSFVNLACISSRVSEIFGPVFTGTVGHVEATLMCSALWKDMWKSYQNKQERYIKVCRKRLQETETSNGRF